MTEIKEKQNCAINSIFDDQKSRGHKLYKNLESFSPKPSIFSPKILLPLLRRKGFEPLSAPLLARGKYYIVANNKRGSGKLLVVNAKTGVVLKQRFISREKIKTPLSLFDFIA